MSFLKKLFGAKETSKPAEDKPPSAPTASITAPAAAFSAASPEAGNSSPWIEADQNPWHLRLLDLRPITQHQMSASKDRQKAVNAVSYGREDGESFLGSAAAKVVRWHMSAFSARILLPRRKNLSDRMHFCTSRGADKAVAVGEHTALAFAERRGHTAIAEMLR